MLHLLQTSSRNRLRITSRSMSFVSSWGLPWRTRTCPTTRLRRSRTCHTTGARRCCCSRTVFDVLTRVVVVLCLPCSFLRTLNLANNNLSHLQGLDSLKHLQHLDLRNNDIYRIAGLDGLPLKSLNLSGNHISDLENLYTLVQLQVLEVADNELVSLSGLQNCKALNVLEASNNLVTNIHEVRSRVRLALVCAEAHCVTVCEYCTGASPCGLASAVTVELGRK